MSKECYKSGTYTLPKNSDICLQLLLVKKLFNNSINNFLEFSLGKAPNLKNYAQIPNKALLSDFIEIVANGVGKQINLKVS